MNIQIGERQLIPADRSLDISFSKCLSLFPFFKSSNPPNIQSYQIQCASGNLLVNNGADIIRAWTHSTASAVALLSLSQKRLVQGSWAYWDAE